MNVDDLPAVDRLDVLVVVDNATDSLSTTPKHVVPEWAGLAAAGRLPIVSGRAICRAHHGLSLLLTAHVGDETRTLLFDAGPDGSTFLQNAAILGIDFGAVDAVALSHGHWDHGGGLLTAVEAIGQQRTDFNCYMHPGMFAQRGSMRADGSMFVHEPLPDPAQLTKVGANVVVTSEPQVMADVFALSGEIPRVTPYETGLPGHVRRSSDGRTWESDLLIMDERFVSVRVRDKGTMVFSACSHAGIVNVLRHAREGARARLWGAMGGLHLSGATEAIIPDTVRDLKQFGLQLFAPGHCTGWRAITALAREFGDELAPSAVGKRYLL
jgi:7,8-dihydropterin-6-yl-methyl-4-(beta-D-ribofuranosyl)aminobenzene 5'-phosphate synthase